MADGRIRKRARRRTRSERAAIVERFHQGGLTPAAFAAQERVSLLTVKRWLAEAKRTAKASPPVMFGEFKLPPLLAPSSPSSPWAVEVVSARGVTIRCREALSMADLVRLLRS